GVALLHRGKVCNMWRHPIYAECRILETTCRLSIRDFVLSATVPLKDEILTAMKHFAFHELLRDIPNNFVPSEHDPTRNAVHDLTDLFSNLPSEILKNCLVVREVVRDPYESYFAPI
ncbi:MAG: hypothetical protein COY83_00070, partial [Parcubacteria group bacterium CG_4_10_14_0_8_um_filter_48_154]